MIVYWDLIVLRGGTELTLATCIKKHRPYVLIDASELRPERSSEKLAPFVCKNAIQRLNFAGPRGSGVPEAHSYTQSMVEQLIDLLRSKS